MRPETVPNALDPDRCAIEEPHERHPWGWRRGPIKCPGVPSLEEQARIRAEEEAEAQKREQEARLMKETEEAREIAWQALYGPKASFSRVSGLYPHHSENV